MNKQDIIDQTRDTVYYRDGGKCQRCRKPGSIDVLELAHILSRSVKNKNMLKKITDIKPDKILNHPLNFKLSCSEHNQSFLIDNWPVEAGNLIKDIINEINNPR
jgi:5-methylcytosine-specific restriction endonuclease McrA